MANKKLNRMEKIYFWCYLMKTITHRIFPTILTEFSYDISNEEESVVHKEFDRFKYRPDVFPKNTINDLHIHIPQFAKFILDTTNTILTDTFKYTYDSIEITNMWASKYEKGHYHAPHTHANNVLSGAYYLTNGTPVQFFDPRPEVLSPTCIESTIDNVSMFDFTAVKGTGVIFPSWLYHWVPAATDTRISISWNIILRGHYGGHRYLQNANI